MNLEWKFEIYHFKGGSRIFDQGARGRKGGGTPAGSDTPLLGAKPFRGVLILASGEGCVEAIFYGWVPSTFQGAPVVNRGGGKYPQLSPGISYG